MSLKASKANKLAASLGVASGPGIAERIQKVHEFSPHVKALFYGRSGTGKTTLASTFPKPLLFLDVQEEGIDSVKDVDADVLAVRSWEDLEMTYWYLQSGNHPYQTVVVDSMTMAQTQAVSHTLAQNGKESMTQQLWGEVSGNLQRIILGFRDLPMHVVFIAHDRVREGNDEEDQLEPEVGPALMPSVGKMLCGLVKLVGNTYIKEVKKQKEGRIVAQMQYRLRVGPHAYYVTKVRSPIGANLPESIHNPTFDKLVKLLKGEDLNA